MSEHAKAVDQFWQAWKRATQEERDDMIGRLLRVADVKSIRNATEAAGDKGRL